MGRVRSSFSQSFSQQHIKCRAKSAVLGCCSICQRNLFGYGRSCVSFYRKFIPLGSAIRFALACLVLYIVIYFLLYFVFLCLSCFRFICFCYNQTFEGAAHTRKPLKRPLRNFKKLRIANNLGNFKCRLL